MRVTIGVFALLLLFGCGTTQGGPPGGGDDAVDPPPPVGERMRMFYYLNGTLGKMRDTADPRGALEAADAACNDGAARRELGGQWRAWLSTSDSDAIARIDDVAPWYRIDRETLLFQTKAELAQGPRASVEPPDGNERMFWTGTNADGSRSGQNCLDWSEYHQPATGTVARADAEGAAWIVAQPLECGTYLALLCIEQ